MKNDLIKNNSLKQFKTHSIITGLFLMIIGGVGIFLPTLMSFAVSVFVGWLLVIGGALSGYHVIKSYRAKLLAWLKPFLLIATGLLILFRPTAGIAAIGLLLMVYFLLDGFAGVTFGIEMRSLKGSGWMIFNGILSFILAGIMIVGWPFSSVWLVGIIVGVSLFMDGIVMFVLGISVHKEE